MPSSVDGEHKDTSEIPTTLLREQEPGLGYVNVVARLIQEIVTESMSSHQKALLYLFLECKPSDHGDWGSW